MALHRVTLHRMGLHRMHRAHGHGRASTRYRISGSSRWWTKCHCASTTGDRVADMECFELVEGCGRIVGWGWWHGINLKIRRG